ncbi:DUF3253 domain-containing protein [Henriciella marina]|uniref:DUF3253 domain-containing protein n=1 Tax=Henriciella marina TaxID=453851 RepID=A0ABT4LX30_9PROT|nr:DUF3253 domain-containing protein [Henriciella marina]MCZ4298933.1 DUF3253 domain-containing protein [Henriciella marina]
MSEDDRKRRQKASLDELIVELVNERGADKTVCPSEVARAKRDENWQQLMGEIRVRAVKLADAGQISIYRKGKPVDPHDFKGVYRLGFPGTE